MLKRLQETVNAKLDVDGVLLMKLDHALRTWTTSIRTASCIMAEDVYTVLAVDDYIVSYNHDLIPAEPFFESRNNLETELMESSSRVFLSGIPGTGKTNIVSKISGKRNSIIDIRDYRKILNIVKSSEVMQKQWKNYQKDFEYATDIVFEETCDAAVQLMDLLMGI